MRRDMLRASSNEWASLPLLRRMIDPAEEKLKGEIMLSSITRARVIQVWLGALAVVVVAAVAFGATVTAGLAGVVLTLSIVPPPCRVPAVARSPVSYGGRRAPRHGSSQVKRLIGP